jgi:hypothetical protein
VSISGTVKVGFLMGTDIYKWSSLSGMAKVGFRMGTDIYRWSATSGMVKVGFLMGEGVPEPVDDGGAGLLLLIR